MQSVISVPLPQNAYAIAIAPGSLDHIGSWITGETLTLKSHKILVVSNPMIFKAYGQRAIESLT
ncbi:MAG: 3-dehydroquinate synthase, partial [Phormidesmis sp. CAN_BIN44]|nr:3-dehydroquinate synthase [Phormidesmis sp. CAN_BIN44]